MKQLFLLLFTVISFYSFSQSEITEPSTLEETIVSYGEKFMNLAETTIENAVELVMTEVPILVSQYLWYKGITFGFGVIIGLILIFYLPKRIIKWFTIDAYTGFEYNKSIDESKEDEYKKPNKYLKIGGNYYKNFYLFLSSLFITMTPVLLGIYLLYLYLFDFIKVVFFPKLYLAELFIEFIK